MKRQNAFTVGWNPLNVKPTISTDGYCRMKKWQARAFNALEPHPYIILNAPTGSGKSKEICWISASKMLKNKSLRCIIAVPQTIIANGDLAKCKLIMPNGEKVDWLAQENYCQEQPDEGTTNSIIKWLKSPILTSLGQRTLACTHASLVKAYKTLKERNELSLFNNLLVWIDEAHHIKNNESEDYILWNCLGELVSCLFTYKTEIGLATATFFRGDRYDLITKEMESKFKRFNLPYDEHLKSMKYLRSFSFDFILCGPDYSKAIEDLAKERKGKDIIYIPHPVSTHSTGDKYNEVDNLISKYKNVHGEAIKNDTLTVIKNEKYEYKILDLVDENCRPDKKKYISTINNSKDSLDSIITLGMFKEGANWIWADRSIIVGPKSSLTDVIQIIGRLFRDAKDKTHVEVIQLLPFSLDQTDENKFRENLNNYLKAIYASLILENILKPVKIKSFKKSNKNNNIHDIQKDYFGDASLDDSKRLALIEDISNRLLEIIDINPIIMDAKTLWNEYEKIVPEILSNYGIEDNVEEIGKQVWSMFARRGLKLQGINVDHIDFDILKETHPLEFLLRYTSDVCGFDTFDKLRKAIIGDRDSSGNKKRLLEMGKNGEPRPHSRSHLGMVYRRYIFEYSDCYDTEFRKEIEKLAPHWFMNVVVENKNKLLEMARNGGPKPTNYKHQLGKVLGHYMSKASRSYDAEFDREIRKLAPHWFINSADENKNKLLEMARNGEPRPIGNKHPLGNSLIEYTRNKKNGSYDAEFDKEIRKLAPHWFINSANENKNKLLEMARNGEPKPLWGKHPLAIVFSHYMKNDLEFKEKIKEIAPHWVGRPRRYTSYKGNSR